MSPDLSPHQSQTYHITMTLYNENTNILRMIYTRFKTTQPKHLLDSKISVFLMTVTHCIVLGNLVIVGDFLLFCTSRVPFLMNYSSFPTSWFTMIVYPVSGLVPKIPLRRAVSKRTSPIFVTVCAYSCTHKYRLRIKVLM